MPNPLSADIRARFELLFAQGLTGREIGRRLMISAASASRLSQKLKQGLRLTPADNPRNTGYGGHLRVFCLAGRRKRGHDR